MYGFEHAGIGGGWMILIWLVPAVLVTLAIRYVVRDRDGKPERAALDILEGRYARGEIDREAFLKRRADLAG